MSNQLIPKANSLDFSVYDSVVMYVQILTLKKFTLLLVTCVSMLFLMQFTSVNKTKKALALAVLLMFMASFAQ